MRRVAGLLLLGAMAGPAFGGGEYRVGPGDKLKLHVYDEDGLSGELQVQDDCTVTVGLVGAMDACGRTPRELSDEIAEALKGDYLLQPMVDLRVIEFKSQRVDVLGEVHTKGPQYLQGPTTILDVVGMAGGTIADNVTHVEVVRADGTSSSYDLGALANSAPVYVEPGSKVFVRPGDLIYVEGEVARPGSVGLADGLTLTRALALVGGPKDYANLRKVKILRAGGEQITVNVTRVLAGKEEDVVLRPDDHLLIPRGAF